MNRQNDRFELNFIELFLFLKKKILIIIAMALLCSLGGYLHGKFLVEPQYTAETRMYVLNRSNSATVVSSDFQASNYMLYDYKVLISGRNVTQEVINRLDLDMSPSVLSNMIEVTAPSNTRVLQIRITDTDPQRAAAIANAVREVAAEQIRSIMEADAVHLVYEADVPKTPSSTRAKNKAVISAFIGLGASLAILTTIFILDDSIRNEEDVERYLGLTVIGVIPASHNLNTASEQMKMKKKRKKPFKKKERQ